MKLSVFVVTYNQERYIRQCLDSIAMQKVNFDYEVIIGDDCSADGTAAICDEFARVVELENEGVRKYEAKIEDLDLTIKDYYTIMSERMN